MANGDKFTPQKVESIMLPKSHNIDISFQFESKFHTGLGIIISFDAPFSILSDFERFQHPLLNNLIFYKYLREVASIQPPFAVMEKNVK
jgi:hypothetical protein